MGTLGNAISTLSDYLQIVSGGFVAPQPSRWVRLVNNATGVAYVSTAATDSTGLWTVANVPTGTYTLSYSLNVGGPWTATGDANYEVAGLDGSPTATANYGLVNIGAGPWDGSTSGFFAGHASGTVVATNAASGFGGNLLDYQVAGVSKFKVSSAGALSLRGGIVNPGQSNGVTNLAFGSNAVGGITAETINFDFGAPTYTITGGFTTQEFMRVQQPTISAGSSLTVTNAATVAIIGAPIAAGSAVITNPYALWVEAGTSRFDGNLTMGTGTKITADSGTVTGAALAATLSKQTGTVTTEALTTAAGTASTYTVTNTLVATTSQVFVAVRNGTNTIQPAYATNIVPGAGSFTVDLRNGHASSALNGTLKFAFWVVP